MLSNMGERLGLAQSYISTPHHIGSSADPNDPTGPICDGWLQRSSSCHVRAMTYTTLPFLNDERHTLAFLPGAHSTRSCVRPACLCSAPVTPVATPGVGRPKSGHVIVLSRCFRGIYLDLASGPCIKQIVIGVIGADAPLVARIVVFS